MNLGPIFPRYLRPASAAMRARGCLAFLLIAGGAAGAGASEVSVTVGEQAGVYQVRGEFSAAVPPSIAWSVLSDYDHIGAFVGSMRESRLERRADGRLVVRQVATAGLFPFVTTLHVELEVTEEPGSTIVFHDTLGRSFRRYAGAWRITPLGIGSRVTYELEARPRAAIPHRLARGMLSRNARGLLLEVRAEMMRRAALAGSTAPSPRAELHPGQEVPSLP